MNKKLFSMTMLCLLASCLAFVACGSDSSGESYVPVTYTSKSGGTTYELVITKNTGKAAFAPGKGDHFTMTITKTGGSVLTSTGSVDSYTSGIFTLLPESGGSFKVTANESAGMTKIEGTITFDDGTTETPPTALTPDKPDGGEDPNSNDINLEDTKWRGVDTVNDEDNVISFTAANNWSIVVKTAGTSFTLKGTYTVKGNNVTLSGELTWNFTVNGNTFVYDGVTYTKQ
jgi:hypothetical protein